MFECAAATELVAPGGRRKGGPLSRAADRLIGRSADQMGLLTAAAMLVAAATLTAAAVAAPAAAPLVPPSWTR